MNITIRQETPDDYSELYDLIRSAFGQDNEAVLVEKLRESGNFIPGLSFVASIENKIVGYILFTKIKIKDSNGSGHDSLALAPMAVKPEYQKQGIGGKLFDMD